MAGLPDWIKTSLSGLSKAPQELMNALIPTAQAATWPSQMNQGEISNAIANRRDLQGTAVKDSLLSQFQPGSASFLQNQPVTSLFTTGTSAYPDPVSVAGKKWMGQDAGVPDANTLVGGTLPQNQGLFIKRPTPESYLASSGDPNSNTLTWNPEDPTQTNVPLSSAEYNALLNAVYGSLSQKNQAVDYMPFYSLAQQLAPANPWINNAVARYQNDPFYQGMSDQSKARHLWANLGAKYGPGLLNTPFAPYYQAVVK